MQGHGIMNNQETRDILESIYALQLTNGKCLGAILESNRESVTAQQGGLPIAIYEVGQQKEK